MCSNCLCPISSKWIPSSSTEAPTSLPWHIWFHSLCLQWKAIQAILNKLGVNKNFPRWVAFGQTDFVEWLF
jgi:hypothetical protein